MLRLLGVDKGSDSSRALMFQAGEANEDIWRRVVVGGWSGTVHHGLEYRKQGSWGTVHGTTDLALSDEGGAVQVILELKLVSALNSAIQRDLEGEPDSKHLVQAAVYMWLAGKPVILCYTNRTDFAVQFQAKKYGVKKIEPFYRMFYLSFVGGQLWYRDEYSSSAVRTLVSVRGIQEYYCLVAEMPASYRLGKRPSSAHVNGNPPAYDRCDYCPLQSVCDKYENDYHTWLHAAKEALE